MHRHGTIGRKLSLGLGQRRALIRGQLTALVLHEQIQTTEAKAREIAPRMERLITRAKLGGVNNLRTVKQQLLTENAVQKLMRELAPAMTTRNGGYTRIVKLGNRRGDNAALAMVTLVLPDKVEVAETKPAEPVAATKPQKSSKVTKAKEASK